MIQILSDSTVDLPPAEAKALNVSILPLTIHFATKLIATGSTLHMKNSTAACVRRWSCQPHRRSILHALKKRSARCWQPETRLLYSRFPAA